MDFYDPNLDRPPTPPRSFPYDDFEADLHFAGLDMHNLDRALRERISNNPNHPRVDIWIQLLNTLMYSNFLGMHLLMNDTQRRAIYNEMMPYVDRYRNARYQAEPDLPDFSLI